MAWWKSIFKVFRVSPSFSYGILVFALLIILGFVVDSFAPFDPSRWGTVPRDQTPSLTYLFGTTTTGQDVFWLTTRAIKNAFILAGLTGVLSLFIALAMGFLGGYLNEKIWGRLVNLCIDSFSIIPGLPFIMVLAFSFRDYISIPLIAMFLSIIGWAWPSKSLRSIVLELRSRTHVYTARASGSGLFGILKNEFFPYVLPWAVTQALSLMVWSIGMETTLGVFGLSSMEQPTVGTILYWAMSYQALMRMKWWWIVPAILVVILMITSLYYISVGLGELLNPRSRLSQLRKELGS